jgi:alpha-glucuronidase
MLMRTIPWLLLLSLTGWASAALAEDGYDLWLRYRPLPAEWVAAYRPKVTELVPGAHSATLDLTLAELSRGLGGLLGAAVPLASHPSQDGSVIVGTAKSAPLIAELQLGLERVGSEGYVIRNLVYQGHHVIVIAANEDIGVLYGAFHFLRLLQTHQPLENVDIVSVPRIQHRILDHWDNLDRTVERGYAGESIWDWHKLPDYLDPRYTDYARACASLGINGTVPTNVNASAISLTPAYIRKLAALADLFRPHGLRVYLTARFSAPMEIGGLKTADPLDAGVRAWWGAKADEIYALIPDFGGFLVKANSEGQPGPQDYSRTHADGANMLADAVGRHGGIVMWRAFVYSQQQPDDRAKQAVDEFVPLDGKFRDNVILQVKNGPIDFQPREPFHPLFGAMPHTPLMLEVQITKEYLGFATHLVYLAPLLEETLRSDTYARGQGSTVARVIDGELFGRAAAGSAVGGPLAGHSPVGRAVDGPVSTGKVVARPAFAQSSTGHSVDNSVPAHSLTGIAGVANIGSDRNWTGSHFDQANWYAFGRLAWDPTLSSRDIAEEWVRMTFSNDSSFVAPVVAMMMGSREAAVDYMTPLGLHHQMARDTHYGPGPWVSGGPRADWTSVYFNRADADGIGFDRTATGSNAVAQYAPLVAAQFSDLKQTPEKLLLWFHHVPWDYKMQSGRTLWDELVIHYSQGVQTVNHMRHTWAGLADKVDAERYAQVNIFLAIQEHEAQWWRDASIAYFETFSHRPLPAGYAPPHHDLQYYEELCFPYAPGIAPRPSATCQ